MRYLTINYKWSGSKWLGAPRVYLLRDDNYNYGYVEGGQFGTVEIDNEAHGYVLYEIVTVENADFFVYSNKIYIPAADSSETVEYFYNVEKRKAETYPEGIGAFTGLALAKSRDYSSYEEAIRMQYDIIAYPASRDEELTEEQQERASNSNSNSSGGCYVATCVYGSYDCPSVWTLRRFRDERLAKHFFGRLFIRFYYGISPTIVKWFGDTTIFKKIWKTVLDSLVIHLQKEGVECTPYKDKEWL